MISRLNAQLMIGAAALALLASGGQPAGAAPLDFDTSRAIPASGPAPFLAAAAAAGLNEPSGNARRQQIVTVAPRVWVTQVNTFQVDEFDVGAFFIPMYGASLEITPPGTGFSLLATGFYGEGDTDVASLVLGEGDGDLTRADVELLLRYRVPNSPIVVFGGPRYVQFNLEYELPGLSVTDESEVVIGELGVGVFGNIGESSRHRFFANFTLGVAAVFYEFDNGDPADEESDTEIGATVDLNLGYEYLVTGWASINVRYRTFLLFGEDDFGQDDITTVHGPEIGLAFRF